MTGDLSLTHPQSGHSSSLAIVAAGLIVACLCGTAFVSGRSTHETAERAKAIEIASENQTFCAGLGFRQESEAYRKCVESLSEIRLRQEQRFATEATGLL